MCTLSLSFNNEGPLGSEFVAAIREGREPNASVGKVLACYEVLAQLEGQLKE